MRPRKIIALIDADELRQSITRFVLKQHMFAVVSFNSADALRKSAQFIDCVVGYWPLNARMARREAHRRDALAVVVAPEMTEAPADLFADALLKKGECSMAQIIDRIKTASVKRRGPKKGSTHAKRRAAKGGRTEVTKEAPRHAEGARPVRGLRIAGGRSRQDAVPVLPCRAQKPGSGQEGAVGGMMRVSA